MRTAGGEEEGFNVIADYSNLDWPGNDMEFCMFSNRDKYLGRWRKKIRRADGKSYGR